MFKEGGLDFSKVENQKALEKKLEEMSPENKQSFVDEKHQEALDIELQKLFEQSEPICVPIEKLIPGIKSKPSEVELNRPHGRNLPDRFSEDLAPIIYRDCRDVQCTRGLYFKRGESVPEIKEERFKERNQKALELESLKDQVVIDLGCTDTPYQTYIIATLFGAKGFIGVDAYDDPKDFFQNVSKSKATEMIKEDLNRYGCQDLEKYGEFGIRPIPGVGIQEDMLSFLRRLPDNSVSIVTSGIDQYVLDTFLGDKMGLVKEIEKEIQRVLSDEGAYLSYQSTFKPDELDVKFNDGFGLRIFKKKEREA